MDTELNDTQKLAVSRALATPDLMVIQGFSGAGKSRVLAEFLRQTDRRGLRVLLVAGQAAPIDAMLERLADDLGLRALRWLGEQESICTLSPRIASLTLSERLRRFHQQTIPTARQAVVHADAILQQRREAHALIPTLENLLATHTRLIQEKKRIESDMATLESTLHAEVEQKQRNGLDDELASLEKQLASTQSQIAQDVDRQKHHEQERAHLASLIQAKQSWRVLSGDWWSALFKGDLKGRFDEVDTACRQLAQQLEQARKSEAALGGRRQQILALRTEERQRFLQSERQRRQEQSNERLREVLRQESEVVANWRTTLPRLGITDSSEVSARALALGQETSVRQLAEAEADARTHRDWLMALEQALPRLPEELFREARLVAGLVNALPELGQFDYVVVIGAHRLSEADLLALSRRGERLVLVGEPAIELPIAPPPKRATSGRPRRTPEVSPFQRLWTLLHPDPRRLPARCRHAHGHLTVTLRPVAVEQQAWLQREPVFDRPEISVGIIAAPDQEPCVAEVIFPGTMSIAEAKAFIHRELQELAIHANGLAPRWSEETGKIRLELSPFAEGDLSEVVIGEGIQERAGRCVCKVGSNEVGWLTTHIEFDKSAGWDRARAEAWIEERLRLRDWHRTVILDRCYHTRPGLVRFVSNLLYGGANLSVGDSDARALLSAFPPVEFVPVPPLTHTSEWAGGNGEWRTGGGGSSIATAPRQRTSRGGAGLEIDLADSRRADTLPHDLRSRLANQGVVNVTEARTVVQALEELIAEPTFQHDCALWQKMSQPASPTIAVVSLFPAQVELLRLLIQSSAVLTNGPPIEVGLPGAFAEQECLVLFVSLTRSHAHRAVPFSEHPDHLIDILTRPVGRLVFFGDLGTMSRRSQWFGVLDHLDETVGPVEQALIGQLLAHLPEQEEARSVRSWESSSV